MKKKCSENEARLKAEAYCSATERCKDDVLRKLVQWGVPADSYEAIIQYLEKERYVDEQRYSRAFVRDKYRFNQWGKIKIVQALKMKRLPDACISVALDEIDEDEYLSILTSLLQKKLKSIKAANDYERNGKLIRFAAGRGYGMEEILRCMKRMGCDDESFE